MDYGDIVKEEVAMMEQRRNKLLNHPKIKPYIKNVCEWVEKTQGRAVSTYEKHNIAQCMYNTILDAGARQPKLFEEATTQDNISFLGVQLPIIAAMIPTLVLNEVAVVQALDRRIGAVFYLDVKYGSTRGAVTAGDTMMSATTGHAESRAGRRYARASVSQETIGTGDGTHAGTTDVNPGVAVDRCYVETLVGTTYTRIGETDSDGSFSSLVGGVTVSGTINTAGTYSVTVGNVDSTASILLSYDYQYDLPKDAYDRRDGVPKATLNMTQEPITAVDYPIRAEWSLGAQIDLQKAHGTDMEKELTKYLGSEIKFTIDQEGLELVDAAAKSDDSAGTITTWDGRPSEGETWKDKKEEFIDRFEEANNLIFDKTKRGVATFAVCGNNVARVLKQLGRDYFTPDANLRKPQTGPYKIGTLNNAITLIQNPFKSTNEYTVGHRGDQFMMAGFVMAPYIPLFSTPTLTTADLTSQKGFMSSVGFKVVNAGMFCAGAVQNIASGYVVGS